MLGGAWRQEVPWLEDQRSVCYRRRLPSQKYRPRNARKWRPYHLCVWREGRCKYKLFQHKWGPGRVSRDDTVWGRYSSRPRQWRCWTWRLRCMRATGSCWLRRSTSKSSSSSRGWEEREDCRCFLESVLPLLLHCILSLRQFLQWIEAIR